MKKLVLTIFILAIFIGGCGSSSSSSSRLYAPNSRSQVTQSLDSIIARSKGITRYELSSDMRTITLYVTRAMESGTSAQKDEFCNTMQEYMYTTVADLSADKSQYNVYVKSEGTGRLLYSTH